MKPIFALLCLTPALLCAQDLTAPGYHTHDGFYLSLNVGAAAGRTVVENTFNGDELTFSGPGSALEIRIGSAVTPNLILSLDLMGRAVVGPTLESGGVSVTADNDYSISDGVFGLGATYYFMPSNVFLSGTVGFGQITEDDGDNRYRTDLGLALNFKVGKEWWVSKNWGLGVAGGYGFVSAEGGDFTNGSFKSNKVFVLFNTTYN